jgi:hypothetical protein
MNEMYRPNSLFVINECISLYSTAFYTHKTRSETSNCGVSYYKHWNLLLSGIRLKMFPLPDKTNSLFHNFVM